MPYTSQQIREAYNRLPQGLRDALDADETDDVIFAIRKELGITIDQMGDLSQEIGAVFVGIAPAANFISAIEKRLGIPREKASEIGRIVDERIFKHIRAKTQEQKKEAGQTAPIVDQRPPAFDAKKADIPDIKPPTHEEISQYVKEASPALEITPTPPMPAMPMTAAETPTPPAAMEQKQSEPVSMPVIPSLMEQKLSAPFSAPAQQTVSGNENMPTPPLPQKLNDPYREPVE